MEKLEIRQIKSEDLRELWEVSYGDQADLEWMKYNGPYFNDPVQTWQEFSEHFGRKSVDHPNRALIIYQDRIVGLLTAYFEDGEIQRWLEFGIVIYDSSLWSKGIGKSVTSDWITYLFELYPEIQRIGFTTWSGNLGMMKLGEKCGLIQEAKIRKVRFVNGKYFDSLKYGVLREEWQNWSTSVNHFKKNS